MNVFLPLRTKVEQKNQLRLALESNTSALAPQQCTIVDNGDDLVCFCDGSSCFLYAFKDNELTYLGTFFFRRVDDRQLLSSLLGEEVRDFPEGELAQPSEAGTSGEVWLSSAGDANFVGFIGDALVIGTKAGYIGAIYVNTERTEMRGKSTRLQCNQTAHWCTSPRCAACICISAGGLVAAFLTPTATTVMTYDDAGAGSCVCAVATHSLTGAAPHCYFITHCGSNDLTTLRLESADSKPYCETYTLLFTDDAHEARDDRAQSSMSVLEWDGGCVLAIMYPGAISFTSWDSASLCSSAAIKNELTAAFRQAFWKRTENGGRLYALRSDAHCLLYDVVVNTDTYTIEEVVVSGQVALPSVVSCRMGSSEKGTFLCWQSSSTLARHTVFIETTDDESSFTAVETRPALRPSQSSATTALLLEVVPIRQSYGIVCLFSNGECHLSLYGERGTMRIAFEEHPNDATSCLAYEARDRAYACVLGFVDGDVRLFVDGVTRAWVRVAHCGAIDKLLWLPKMNEADDTLFVSISTEMGTVCFHAGDSAAVSRTMSSPSQPLTSCLLDKELEYMFLFSDTTGNLWHLPTCRLERAFRSHLGAPDRHFDDLLEYHWASATKVLKFCFAGGQYYAVNVNVDLLISSFDAGQSPQQQPSQEYLSALSLILRCLGESCAVVAPTTDAFGEALEDLGLIVAGAETYDSVWCATLMLCELLNRTSDAVSAAAIFATVQSLSAKLVHCGARDARRQADALQQFVARFFTLSRATPTPYRHALQSLVGKCTVSSIRAVLSTLQSRSAVAASAQNADIAASAKNTNALQGEQALSTLLMVSSIASQRADYSIRDDAALFTFLCRTVNEALRCVTTLFQDEYALFSRSTLLLGLVESYAVVRIAGENDLIQALLRLLVKESFSGKKEEVKQASLEALERLVAHDPQEFLTNVIAPTFQNHPAFRPYIVVFLAHLVKNFPTKSYSAFGAMADIFMTGLSDSAAASRDDSAIFSTAVSQLVRLSVASLPNVSLQPSQHHLAVGRRDGKVVVYNIKTASIVTTFQAHQAPLLGVAYSGNIVTLDIATIAEPMNEIKIWRSANQASSIATFFGGATGTNFKLISSVEVPSTGRNAADASLLIKHFHLNWLSPQCLEFASPWHGKIQVSLP